MNENALEISIGKLVVFAPNLDAAVSFYAETLGLSLTGSGESFRLFSGRDFELVVFDCDESAKPSSYSECAGSAIAFRVPNLDETIRDLESKGVKFLHAEPQTGPHSRYVAFSDPFGTVHELVEDLR